MGTKNSKKLKASTKVFFSIRFKMLYTLLIFDFYLNDIFQKSQVRFIYFDV